jgi:hypothetical protein
MGRYDSFLAAAHIINIGKGIPVLFCKDKKLSFVPNPRYTWDRVVSVLRYAVTACENLVTAVCDGVYDIDSIQTFLAYHIRYQW